jgi:hypothetical protein
MQGMHLVFSDYVPLFVDMVTPKPWQLQADKVWQLPPLWEHVTPGIMWQIHVGHIKLLQLNTGSEGCTRCCWWNIVVCSCYWEAMY